MSRKGENEHEEPVTEQVAALLPQIPRKSALAVINSVAERAAERGHPNILPTLPELAAFYASLETAPPSPESKTPVSPPAPSTSTTLDEPARIRSAEHATSVSVPFEPVMGDVPDDPIATSSHPIDACATAAVPAPPRTTIVSLAAAPTTTTIARPLRSREPLPAPSSSLLRSAAALDHATTALHLLPSTRPTSLSMPRTSSSSSSSSRPSMLSTAPPLIPPTPYHPPLHSRTPSSSSSSSGTPLVTSTPPLTSASAAASVASMSPIASRVPPHVPIYSYDVAPKVRHDPLFEKSFVGAAAAGVPATSTLSAATATAPSPSVASMAAGPLASRFRGIQSLLSDVTTKERDAARSLATATRQQAVMRTQLQRSVTDLALLKIDTERLRESTHEQLGAMRAQLATDMQAVCDAIETMREAHRPRSPQLPLPPSPPSPPPAPTVVDVAVDATGRDEHVARELHDDHAAHAKPNVFSTQPLLHAVHALRDAHTDLSHSVHEHLSSFDRAYDDAVAQVADRLRDEHAAASTRTPASPVVAPSSPSTDNVFARASAANDDATEVVNDSSAADPTVADAIVASLTARLADAIDELRVRTEQLAHAESDASTVRASLLELRDELQHLQRADDEQRKVHEEQEESKQRDEYEQQQQQIEQQRLEQAERERQQQQQQEQLARRLALGDAFANVRNALLALRNAQRATAYDVHSLRDQLSAEVASIASIVDMLQRALDDARGREQDALARLAVQQRDLHCMAQECADWRASAEAAHASADELVDRVRALEDAAKRRAAEVEEVLNEHRSRIASSEQVAHERQVELERQRETNDRTLAQLSRAEHALNELRAVESALRTSLDESQAAADREAAWRRATSAAVSALSDRVTELLIASPSSTLPPSDHVDDSQDDVTALARVQHHISRWHAEQERVRAALQGRLDVEQARTERVDRAARHAAQRTTEVRDEWLRLAEDTRTALSSCQHDLLTMVHDAVLAELTRWRESEQALQAEFAQCVSQLERATSEVAAREAEWCELLASMPARHHAELSRATEPLVQQVDALQRMLANARRQHEEEHGQRRLAESRVVELEHERVAQRAQLLRAQDARMRQRVAQSRRTPRDVTTLVFQPLLAGVLLLVLLLALLQPALNGPSSRQWLS